MKPDPPNPIAVIRRTAPMSRWACIRDALKRFPVHKGARGTMNLASALLGKSAQSAQAVISRGPGLAANL